MPPDERALLAQIATGDQHAMKCLYALYRQRLWSYLYHQLAGDAGWTEEVTQDVFLAVWRSADTYRGEAQVGTLLFRIAHNLAANARRTRRRHPLGQPFQTADDGDEPAEPVVTYDSHEEAVLDRLMLQQALDHLSPRHREVLDLAFYQGFGSAEIALILGVPEGTVKSRISYARKALSACLQQLNAREGVVEEEVQ